MWKSYCALVGLAMGSLTPLVLTATFANEMVALVMGILFAIALIRLTIDPSPFFYNGATAKFDKMLEKNALDKGIMTSSLNRCVRICLGSVYAYISFTFAIASLGTEHGSVRLQTQLYNVDLNAWSKLALTTFGCLANNYFAGLWISSGYMGQ